jgi:hypothetical protein
MANAGRGIGTARFQVVLETGHILEKFHGNRGIP